MKLEILHVPDCPNVAILEQRIRQATAGRPVQPEITHRVIADPGQAAAAGMTGSPTLLVDGHDPFATPGQVPSVSCRLYPSDAGRLDGAPPVAALRAALRLAPDAAAALGDDTASSCCTPPAATESPATVLRARRAAAQPADPAEKAVHQAILRSFATEGRAPTSDELTETADGLDVPVDQLLRRLHDADIVRLDATGDIAAAYPFSSTPTPHRVRVAGGATVSAMCAVDALGMAAMLDTPVTITSADPVTADPITVTVDGGHVTAQPATTAVFVGAQAGQGPSADTCCHYLNFFTDRASAQGWADTHPGIGGVIVELPDAHHLGTTIFGHLLHS
ncbi:alkylmercury lyase family protein [Rhodococcus artemisiae]|uniref:Alkylmercury lyase family protein n=1 Tax=Rhodococcus artemisiae TaxID=714159 RepID=A0ABU7LJJ6_9NOCA|nr:alkylmercury lyase family protein [Rhodococcus artemisiae]MEE2061734.1 alkylmercury lyase family protein [Rhodococcus artemisiae]